MINAIDQMKASTQKKLDVRPLDLDLSSLRNVDAAAQAFMKAESRLDILINNAGVCFSLLAPDPEFSLVILLSLRHR